ncbi:MAG: hypothetical protein ACFCD0_14500 [Gemmataceae bacterium]
MMQILLPEVITEMRGLSLILQVLCLTIGISLWTSGWKTYRFWVVLSGTVVGGIYGLYTSPFLGVQPMFGALLLAISVGMLAMSLMRIIAFVLGGITCLVVAKFIAPSVDAPLICFLSGGIAATLLFRLWMMSLTSALGGLLFSYGVLSVLTRLAKMDGPGWCTQHPVLLNWVCFGLAISGTSLQLYLSRPGPKPAEEPKADEEKGDDEKKEDKNDDAEKKDDEKSDGDKKGPWTDWTWVQVPFLKKTA